MSTGSIGSSSFSSSVSNFFPSTDNFNSTQSELPESSKGEEQKPLSFIDRNMTVISGAVLMVAGGVILGTTIATGGAAIPLWIITAGVVFLIGGAIVEGIGIGKLLTDKEYIKNESCLQKHFYGRIDCAVRVPIYLLTMTAQITKIGLKLAVLPFTLIGLGIGAVYNSRRNKPQRDLLNATHPYTIGITNDAVAVAVLFSKVVKCAFCAIFYPPGVSADNDDRFSRRPLTKVLNKSCELVFTNIMYSEDRTLCPWGKGRTSGFVKLCGRDFFSLRL